MKDKGFTLIELIVAMGIGSVVLLMISLMLVRGTSLFREENDVINVQNDYQLIRNQLDQIIMEAKTLIIEKQGDDIIIYTGDIDGGVGRTFLTTNKTTERVIVYEDISNTIYMASDYASARTEGNVISDLVAKFNIEIDPSCIKEKTVEGTVVKYCINPVRVNVEIGLAKKKKNQGNASQNTPVEFDVSSKYTINLRNKLDKISIYTTANANASLSGLENVISYEVK